MSDDDGGVRCYDDRTMGASPTPSLSTLSLMTVTTVNIEVFAICAACVTSQLSLYALAC